MRKWIDLLKETYREWSQDNCLQIGAALSFYTLGSLIPLLLVLTSIMTYVALFTGYGQSITNDVLNYIRENVGEETANALNTALETRSQELATGSIISAAVGFVTLLLTASGVFGQLSAAFDQIWDVPPEERPQGIWGMIRAKLFSFGMVLAVAFILLVSTILTAVINALAERLSTYIPGGSLWLPLVNILVQLALISFVFMLLFKYLPSTRVAWRDVAYAGVLTAVLWIIGQQLLALYLSRSGFSSYGVIGGVLAFLVYVYYSSQIVFFGGEFTQVYARHYGSRAGQPVPATSPAGPTEATGAQRDDRRFTQHEALAAARTRQIAAATVAGVLGLVTGALVGVLGLMLGAARGVARLRQR
ncbi:YihY/virulence factor BrkB family protein [Kallotenue papyrolyticum]|uniref:YihY/virulence factor BrkB family protein n=1 Tax=Kallotenue papyrolyticum TaxID=1325125 RepID=UPI00047867B6|nr:YihY/virulence factor BrkB family protein [Kallotenue papyrolyticum]